MVESKIKFVYSAEAAPPPPLYLDGEDLRLRSIAMNGKPLVEVRHHGTICPTRHATRLLLLLTLLHPFISRVCLCVCARRAATMSSDLRRG